LRFLVIDEAHIVEQWGDEFRSSFQEIAGIRRDLRRLVVSESSEFSTLLLTATLTNTAIDTLQTLFGDNQPLVSVSAAQLRPEPSYWAVKMATYDERIAVVLDAVRHLPRPLMLYVTEPAEAENWAMVLHASGYHRCDVVTGRTPNAERGRVIGRWRDADTDIVVATSAFGLGVDQADVRVVIHATVPENVDRFYQEVGRGGRDGRASASIVFYTEEDVKRARAMNRKKLIGIKRGRERWASMFKSHKDMVDNRVRIPINERPNLTDGIDMDNDMNRAWNIRTLTLMSRAGLLSFDAEEPPKFTLDSSLGLSENEAVDRYLATLAEQQQYRVVKLNHHGTVTHQTWEERIEPLRRTTAAADRRGHDLMLELLKGERCAGEVLRDAYSISEEKGELSRPEVAVAIACGGCKYCRSINRAPYATPLPTPLPKYATTWNVGTGLMKICGVYGGVAIFYSTKPSIHELSRLFRWLVGQGIRLVVAPEELLEQLSSVLYQPNANHPPVFTFPLNGFRFMQTPTLPSLVFLPPRAALSENLQNAFNAHIPTNPLRILFVDSNTLDAVVSRRVLRSTLSCRTFQLEEFLAQAGL
jgi:hypothetical protein